MVKFNLGTLEGKIQRYCEDFAGADPYIIKWIYTIDDYGEFRRKLRAYAASSNENGDITDDDLELIDSCYDIDSFIEYKKRVNEIFAEYEHEALHGREENDIYPAREILNGNFPKYDKSKLTPTLKIDLNVDGLDDAEYDIYVNTKTGLLMPVYYNICTHNEKWFAFSVYLKKLYSVLKIDANPYAPLITFNRDLLGIDCLAENNTPELNGLVAAECGANIIFAIRECARFKNAKGELERTELSLGDWTWLWLYAQCMNTYREAPRQTGKTFLMTMVFGIEFAIAYKDLMAIVVHFKSKEAIKNRNKMLESANALPRYLKYQNIKYKTVKGKEKIEFTDTDNTGGGSVESINVALNNKLKTVAVGKTESTAEQAGRGDTSPLISADEINFISNMGVLLTALTFAHSTARTVAKNAGKRYGMHFTSTAGKLNTKHGKEMHNLIYNRMCMFQPELFGYSLEDLETYLKTNGQINYFVIKYEYDELGYTEEWLDDRISQAKGVQDILTEIFQKWLSLDATSLFKIEQIKRLEGLLRFNIEKNFIFKKNSLIKFFPTSNTQTFDDVIRATDALLFGVDIAAGGGDYSVIYGLDMTTLRPIMTFRINTLVATDFAIATMDIFKYIKKLKEAQRVPYTMVINPEQNGPGLTYIPMLIKDKDIEPHVFRHIRNYDKRINDDTLKPWHRKFSRDTYIEYGSNMRKTTNNGRSLRDVLFEDNLFEIVDKYPFILATQDLASEVFTLCRKGGKVDGKIEAKKGFHDDSVCAMLHGASVVLLEEYRVMLNKFYNYTVDSNKIENMALNSYVDTMSELGMYQNLDKQVDYELKTVRAVGGITYQIMKIFKYKNGIKYEIKDSQEKNEIIRTNDEIRTAFANMKRLTVEEYTFIDKHNIEVVKNDIKQEKAKLHDMLREDVSGTKVSSVYNSFSAENRTNSQSYRQKNKFNTKAKMF